MLLESAGAGKLNKDGSNRDFDGAGAASGLMGWSLGLWPVAAFGAAGGIVIVMLLITPALLDAVGGGATERDGAGRTSVSSVIVSIVCLFF